MKKTNTQMRQGRLLWRFFIIIMTALVSWPACSQAGLLIDCAWLKAHLDEPDIRIADVSKVPSSFEKGHIPGSVKVFRHRDLEDYTRYPPVGYPMPVQFVRLMARLGITNNTTVVVYDDNKNIYASRLIFLLRLYGHSLDRLKILDGGKKAWKGAGLPLETGTGSPVKAAPYNPMERKDEFLAAWQDVYREVVQEQNPKAFLLDTRTMEEFQADRVRCVRGGHIPGAVHLDLASVVTKDGEGRWKDAPELEHILKEKGAAPDRDIIVYCHSGDRSAHAFVIMKYLLGYPRVRIYEKAWLEWAVLQALPVEE